MSRCHRLHSGSAKPVRIVVLTVLLMAATTSFSMASEFQRNFKFEGQEFELTNLVGEIIVLPAPGSHFIVEVAVHGEDADESLMNFSSSEGRQSNLAVKFPVDEHKKYVYPPMGKRSSATIYFKEDNPQEKSWLRKIFSGFSGEKIKVEGSGRGLEMWADVTIMVPEGGSLVVVNGVGKISASDIKADLNLDISSGSILANSIEGKFIADTGSGEVIARNITGDANLDTGSGSVEVDGFKGNHLLIDTGSGQVTVKRVVCEKLDIDTGSGGVEARQVATDQAVIDTGSGSVVLQLDRMGTGEFEVDTGSGSIDLILPENASATIVADTGSGDIDVELSGAMIKSKDDDRVELVIGSGKAKVELDTGSGSIEISQ